MNKKILISLSVIAAVAAVIVGGTMAYLSDTETSAGNTFTAGELDLTVNSYDDPLPILFTIKDLKPSTIQYTGPIVLHIYHNPGKLYKHIVSVVCNQGAQTEPEEEEENGVPKYDLDNYTWFDLKVDDAVIIPDGTITVKDITSKWIYLGEYPASQDVTVIQSFHLDKDVTNWAQGDSCEVTEQFMVLQTNAPHPVPCYNCPP